MVITESISRSLREKQEDIIQNADAYRRQFAEKVSSARDSYERVGSNEIFAFTYDRNGWLQFSLGLCIYCKLWLL